MNDPDTGRDNREGVEGLLAPLEEFVAFAVANEFDLHVAIERELRSGEIDLDGVVDDEVDGDERLDFRGIGTAGDGRIAHGGDIDEQGHAGEVLENDAGDGERDFEIAGVLGVVVGEVSNVVLGDLAAIDVSQHGLEDDADGNGESGNVRETLLSESRERVEFSCGSGAGGKGAKCVHGETLPQNGGGVFREFQNWELGEGLLNSFAADEEVAGDAKAELGAEGEVGADRFFLADDVAELGFADVQGLGGFCLGDALMGDGVVDEGGGGV